MTVEIKLYGFTPNSNTILWYQNSSEIELFINNLMCAETLDHFEPISMEMFANLVNFVATSGKLSDLAGPNQSTEEVGLGWVKTFHVLINLCKLIQKQKCFDEERVKQIFVDCLHELKKKGFDINAPLVLQSTKPLHTAAFYDCAPLCAALLIEGANVEEFESIYDTKTALHVAAEVNRVGVIKELINRGANVNVIDKDGKTPLMAGAYYPEVIKTLLEKGADLKAEHNDDIYGRTAFQKAVRAGAVRAVQTFLGLGVRVSQMEYTDLCQRIDERIADLAYMPQFRETELEFWKYTALRLIKYINTMAILNATQFQYGLEEMEFKPVGSAKKLLNLIEAKSLNEKLIALAEIAKGNKTSLFLNWEEKRAIMSDYLQVLICEIQKHYNAV